MSSKRIFDIIFALIGLTVFSPLLIIISILILLEDGLPVVFVQDRLGVAMKSFKIFKFRTMNQDKVTWVGRWIRKTGLDEVLQFINVLQGSMSMVGPRPLTEMDVGRLGWGQGNAGRFMVRPGVTGLAQIYAGRGIKVSAFFERKYLREQSIWLDVKVIMLSFLVNVVGKHRVRQWLNRCRNVRKSNR